MFYAQVAAFDVRKFPILADLLIEHPDSGTCTVFCGISDPALLLGMPRHFPHWPKKPSRAPISFASKLVKYIS